MLQRRHSGGVLFGAQEVHCLALRRCIVWHSGSALLGVQETHCLALGKCIVWHSRGSLFGTQETHCLTLKRCIAWRSGGALFGAKEAHCLVLRRRIVWRSGGALFGAQEVHCLALRRRIVRQLELPSPSPGSFLSTSHSVVHTQPSGNSISSRGNLCSMYCNNDKLQQLVFNIIMCGLNECNL